MARITNGPPCSTTPKLDGGNAERAVQPLKFPLLVAQRRHERWACSRTRQAKRAGRRAMGVWATCQCRVVRDGEDVVVRKCVVT
jgi:hypothetical protein